MPSFTTLLKRFRHRDKLQKSPQTSTHDSGALKEVSTAAAPARTIPQKKIGFLDLPAEVRNEIYDLLPARWTTKDWWTARSIYIFVAGLDRLPRLARTCRQIQREYLSIWALSVRVHICPPPDDVGEVRLERWFESQGEAVVRWCEEFDLDGVHVRLGEEKATIDLAVYDDVTRHNRLMARNFVTWTEYRINRVKFREMAERLAGFLERERETGGALVRSQCFIEKR